MNLKNKVAVVTGASSGLGKLCTELLVGKGATVFGLARRKNRLNDLSKKLGESFIPVICDISKAKQISKAFDKVH